MKCCALLLLFVACEKSGPVEVTPGVTSTSTPAAPAAPVIVDAAVATVPVDAAAIASDAAQVAVVDAGTKPAPKRDPRARLLEEQANAMAMILAGDDKDAGDMTARRPGADLGREIQNVRDAGSGVVIGGGGSPGTRVGGPVAPTPPTTQSGPTGRISVARKRAVDDTTLEVTTVLAKIQAVYFPGIKRCYRDALKRDPTMRGKLALAFTVDPVGRTSTANVTGVSTEIAACVSDKIPSWRFPAPTKDGDPVSARFELDLQLVPD